MKRKFVSEKGGSEVISGGRGRGASAEQKRQKLATI